MIRLGAVFFSALFLASVTLAQNLPTSKFRTPPTNLSMPMVAPLFLDDKDFSSTVTLVNDAIAQMSTRVVVLDSSGVQVAFKEVVMPGHTNLPIQIRHLLSEAGSAANFGSVLVIPEPSPGMPIGAQLSIASKTGTTPAYIEEEMLPQDEGRQGIYRAAALAVKGSSIIALKSLGQSIQSVTLQCFAEKTTPTKGTVQVLPGQLLLVAACDPSQTGLTALNDELFNDQIDRGAVGVSVSTTGSPGDLVTFGFSIYNDERGPYFSSLNFTNPTEQQSSSTIFTGIPVGSTALFPRTMFHPEVAISNFSNKAAEVTVTLAHTIGGDTSTEVVQKLLLAGQSTHTVQIPAHGDSAMTNSLIVRSTLQPGDVVAQFTAWGDLGVRTIELQAKDADSPQNGGGHPWDIRDGATSMLLLFNHGSNTTKKIDVQISSGSEFWWKVYQLAPMETKAININDIVVQGIPDDRGLLLPKTAVQGQIAWFSGFPKWAKGRLMVSRPREGLARSFSCGTCNTDCNHSSLSPNSSITIGVGGANYLGDIQLKTCSINCNEMGCGTTVTGSATPNVTRWSPPDGTVYYTGTGGLTRFTATGTSAGTSSESFNTQDDTGQGNNCWSAGGGSITVACPTTTTVSSLTALSITLLFPSLKTGIGAVSSMQTGPTTSNWDGSQITESLTTTSNSCPSTWGNLCSGSSTFTVGEGGQATVSVNGVETEVGPVFPEQQNMFYDQHTLVSNVSLLPTSSGTTSCTAVCTQTYSCNGTSVGTHTITYSFIEALISGTHVTSTEVSKQ